MKKLILLTICILSSLSGKSQEFYNSFDKQKSFDQKTKAYGAETAKEIFSLINLESRRLLISDGKGERYEYVINQMSLPKDSIIIECVSKFNKKNYQFKIYKQSPLVRVMEAVSDKERTLYITTLNKPVDIKIK